MGLILNRMVNEKIIINHNIVITVAEIRRQQVRLMIDAPRDVVIHREEVERKIQAAEAATDVKPSVMDRKGLAGANAEKEMYLNQHKSYQSPQDDLTILHRMEEDL